MAKKQIIDIDLEFDGFELDETAIRRATASKKVVEARENNGWKQKNEQRYNDPSYSKKVGKSISETYLTEEGRKKQSAKAHAQTESAKEKIRQANLGKNRKGEDWITAMAEKQKGNTKRCRPMVTPIGVFTSLKEAVKHTGIHANRLRRYTRELPWSKEYYHITKEEYIMLTGKEI